MVLELMRDEMVRQISAKLATETQIAAYLDNWNVAIMDNGKPIPCPFCYLNGEVRRLKPVSEEHGIAVVRCEQCRERIEYESPETR